MKKLIYLQMIIFFMITVFTAFPQGVYAAGSGDKVYALQAGVYNTKENADSVYTVLKRNGFNDAYRINVNGSYKVFAGRYGSKALAEAGQTKLAALGIDSYVTQIVYSWYQPVPNIPKPAAPPKPTVNPPVEKAAAAGNVKNSGNTVEPDKQTVAEAQKVESKKDPAVENSAPSQNKKSEVYVITAEKNADASQQKPLKNDIGKNGPDYLIFFVLLIIILLITALVIYLLKKNKKKSKTV